MSMTRTELARQVHDAHGGLTLRDSRALVDALIEEMREGLLREGRLVLSGFGTFRVVERKGRVGYDMGKRRPVLIPARRVVVFLPSRRHRRSEGP